MLQTLCCLSSAQFVVIAATSGQPPADLPAAFAALMGLSLPAMAVSRRWPG